MGIACRLFWHADAPLQLFSRDMCHVMCHVMCAQFGPGELRTREALPSETRARRQVEDAGDAAGQAAAQCDGRNVVFEVWWVSMGCRGS